MMRGALCSRAVSSAALIGFFSRRHQSTPSHPTASSSSSSAAAVSSAGEVGGVGFITPEGTGAATSSSSSSSSPLSSTSPGGGGVGSAVSLERVWTLWNEGNLFSLSVSEMVQFLTSVGMQAPNSEAEMRKSSVVRRIEEYLHARDSGAIGGADSTANNSAGAGGGASSSRAGASALSSYSLPSSQHHQHHQQQAYGRWSTSTIPPETLLDLAQSGFYEGNANMAPKAFQLLPEGSAADVVISRVNTIAFPGFPANTECYTLTAADAAVALQARFSKVLQWCFINMSNLQMDGELSATFGKLLVQPSAATRQSEAAVSSYTLQQRMQLNHPYTWVTALPESAVDRAEQFITGEGFAPVGKSSKLTYEGTIRRAKDQLHVELDEQGKLLSVQGEWVPLQTVYHTHSVGPDVRLLLRSRAPVRRQDVEVFRSTPIIALSSDDVNDVLPPEHGQLTYLSENETKRFEKVNEKGIVIVVTEVKRQPLIVLHDHEEDMRVEFSVSVLIPATAGGGRSAALDVRAVGLEMFELADRFAREMKGSFDEAFGCGAETVETPVKTAPASAAASTA